MHFYFKYNLVFVFFYKIIITIKMIIVLLF